MRIPIIGVALAALALAACAVQPDGSRRLDAEATVNTAVCVAPLVERMRAIAAAEGLDATSKAAEATMVTAAHLAANPACAAALDALRQRPAEAGR
jgi:hypothetical protein